MLVKSKLGIDEQRTPEGHLIGTCRAMGQIGSVQRGAGQNMFHYTYFMTSGSIRFDDGSGCWGNS
jgi:hypothetical protein